MKSPQDTAKAAILEGLRTMPEEAFSWLVLALQSKAMMHGAGAQVWPDGIGGFSAESKHSIAGVREAAQHYTGIEEP